MKKKKYIILIFVMLFFSLKVNCASVIHNFALEKYIFYEKSKKELKNKHFSNAIGILEKIKQNHTNSFFNDKIQINLIYAYYKNDNFYMAQKNIEEFIQLYPNHLNMDYVIYIQCLINMKLDQNRFLNIFPINYHKNDPKYAINAFFQLKNFISLYPKSLYITNAKKNLIYLKNRLSQHDLKILKFYFNRQEYISVINRGEEILQKYSETPAARKALIYIKKSYIALKMFDTARKISQIISLNKI